MSRERAAMQLKVARFLCALFDDDWSEGKGWHLVNARRLLDMIEADRAALANADTTEKGDASDV